MKRYFIASLCCNGLLGGGISADGEGITFHTGKMTVPKEYRHLEMKYRDISGVTAGWMLIFPTVTVRMHADREYKFVLFDRKRFIGTLKENGIQEN